MSRFAQSPSLKFAAFMEPVWPVCFCFASAPASAAASASATASARLPTSPIICQSQLHAHTAHTAAPLHLQPSTCCTSNMSSTPLAGLANNATSAQSAMNLLSLENPVFCCYLFWATVLVVKMLLMSLLTALQRFRYKVSNAYSPQP